MIAFVLTDIIFLIVSFVLFKDGLSLVSMLTKHGQISPAVGFSMNYIYAIIPLGYGLMSLRLVQNIIRKIREIINYNH